MSIEELFGCFKFIELDVNSCEIQAGQPVAVDPVGAPYGLVIDGANVGVTTDEANEIFDCDVAHVGSRQAGVENSCVLSRPGTLASIGAG